FFSSRRRHTRSKRDWSSDVCSSDLFQCSMFNCHFVMTANTHTAPPCGTSGNSPGRPLFKTFCIPTGSTPHPDCTAMYCLPSIANDVGWLVMPELVGNCQRSFPVFAS